MNKQLTISIILIFLIFGNTNNIAQVYFNPVFDRTDTPSFRVEKVENINDTTFVHCLFHTEENTWANISKTTILRDCISKKEYKMLCCRGLPYAPNSMHFSYNDQKSVILCFQKKPDSIKKFDIIESSNAAGFNIYGIDLLQENKKTLYSYDLDYAISLSKRAEFFISAKNYTKGIELEKQALEIKKIYLGKKSHDYALSVLNLSSYYNLAADYENAINWGKLNLTLCEELLGTKNETYGISLLNLSSYYHSAEKYDDALIYGRKAIELFLDLYGEEHKHYAEAISNYSETLYANGRYQEAIALAEKGLNIRERLFGKRSVEYSMSLHCLALDYAAVGDILKAIKLVNEALDIKKELLGELDISYISSLNNLASFYSLKDDYSSAIKTELDVLKLSEYVFGINSPKYAMYAENISGYYLKIGNNVNADRYSGIAKKIFAQVSSEESHSRGIHLNNIAMNYFYHSDYANAIKYGENALKSIDKSHPDYGVALGNIALFYSKISDFCNAVKYQSQTINQLKEQMLKDYSNLDFESKYIYWQSKHSLIDDVYPLYVWNCSNDSSLVNLYDETVFSKGIVYREDVFNHPKCKDILKKLNDDDIAIEFISPSNISNDTIFYFALILKKGMQSPRMIKLFHGEQFKDSLRDATSNYDKDLKVGHLVWGPLKEYLKDVKNIYFSATHILHAIPIENLPYNNREYYSERYNIYRLTSTSEMAIPHPKPKYKLAVLYGGLNYDNYLNENESTSQRAGFEPLYQTEPEVQEIERYLYRNHINYKEYFGRNGTELSFKNLSGTPVDIIHVATHGMYVDNVKLEKFQREGDYKFLPQEYNSFYQSNGLSTSFLVMSGGNRPFVRIPSHSHDDGILTALEISKLDLSKTEIVSLSACESGKGAFGADDSIIGLQRGFKLARALTILMTLDKIDDEAAKILMVEFYRNLMSGKSKLQSLNLAQQYLRKVDNGKYNDPKYWASFIMLDGLN